MQEPSNQTQIDWVLELTYFIVPFHFRHFPQSQTLRLYKMGPIGRPCPSCGGHKVSALDMETHLLFNMLFLDSAYLEKMPEGFIRAAFHL